MKRITVAIDGPTGAGKTTVARRVARELGLVYVDTGAMYRAVGLFVLRRGIDSRDAAKIIACLPHIALEMTADTRGQRVILNGEDVTDLIRGEIESRYASDVSAIAEVRAFLLDAQRALADGGGVIMEGRDIGSVVLPGADVKIFLTADSLVRAKRRHAELISLGHTVGLDAVHAALNERDKNDSTRAQAPLKPAEGAVILDSTELNFEQVCDKVKLILKERTGV